MRHFLNTGQNYVKAGTCDTAAKEWCVQLVCVQLICAFRSFFRELYMKVAVVLEHGTWREAVMHLPQLLGNTDVLQMCVVALTFGFYFYH